MSGSGWALGVLARCEALVARGPSAEQHYRAAVAHLTRSAVRPELARAHLLYGEWLRRAQRRTDARTHLRAAHELFADIGMDAFADRARRELSAVGDKVGRRTVETRHDLTAQERHIAQLARAGLSNAEIGARLYISARTVEWHLGKVFTKLGVGSRRELAATALVPTTRGPSG